MRLFISHAAEDSVFVHDLVAGLESIRIGLDGRGDAPVTLYPKDDAVSAMVRTPRLEYWQKVLRKVGITVHPQKQLSFSVAADTFDSAEPILRQLFAEVFRPIRTGAGAR